MNHKVFVTGMGAVTSLGGNISSTFDNIYKGESACQINQDWLDVFPLKAKASAEVRPWDNKFIERQSRRNMSKMSEMLCQAFTEALNQAQLNNELMGNSLSSIIVGSTAGSQSNAEEFFTNLKKGRVWFFYKKK
jgi:3-oxoacyl-[acyl-carrier-protein] synthase II